MKFLVKFLMILSLCLPLFAEKTYKFRVDGMHCSLCTAMVRDAVRGVDGVIKVKATLKDKSVVVEASDSVKVEELLEAIATTGYQGEILE